MSVRILTGDCRELLVGMEAESVDSCVCDPPYHLTSIVKRFGAANAAPAKVGATGAYARASRGFMGQTWDGGDVAFDPATWEAVFRVLKPGAHLVAFSGTRTYHRMVCAIEDAGFEIRDQLAWIYGSGFPKSHDVSKQIDKAAGAEREIVGKGRRAQKRSEGWDRPWMQRQMEEAGGTVAEFAITAPATPEAEQWRGWGTALKPAWEPICLARKPLIGTVAANVLQHGTGALNIDGCRIGTGELVQLAAGKPGFGAGRDDAYEAGTGREYAQQGRWPANILHDGSEEVLAGFPETASGSIMPHHVRTTSKTKNTFGERDAPPEQTFGDSGSAARFFYCAKATSAERGEGNGHPTVKPVALMQWLVRLITPKGGTVLDPFAGSGSTLIAADLGQFDAIGCELLPEYAAIAERRVRVAAGLFGQVEAA